MSRGVGGNVLSAVILLHYDRWGRRFRSTGEQSNYQPYVLYMNRSVDQF